MKCKTFSFTQEFLEEVINDWLKSKPIEIISITQSQFSSLINVVIIYREKI